MQGYENIDICGKLWDLLAELIVLYLTEVHAYLVHLIICSFSGVSRFHDSRVRQFKQKCLREDFDSFTRTYLDTHR